jgi:molecular chaperone DnaK
MGKIIGIDLGTTYSAAGVFDERQGKFLVIRSRTGTSTTPSVVGYKDGQMLVGVAAKSRAALDPDNTVAEIKRHMGEPFRDPQKRPRLGPDGNPVPYVVKFAGKDHSPQMISAYILKDIKEQAEAYLGEPVTGAVITVPAYFEEGARRATKEAGSLAGLEVKCLVSEPTAAAIAFGMDAKRDDDDDDEHAPRSQRVLVYDLGGGTFDVSVIEIQGGNVEVKGVDGDHYLGGIDFDRAIVEWALRKIKAEHDVDLQRWDGLPTSVASAFKQAYNRICGEAEKLKISLSSEQSTTLALPFLFPHPTRGEMINIEYPLSRGEFLTMVAPLLKKTLGTVDRTLEAIKLGKSDIDHVLLVGGSTRIPKIRDMLEKHFGKPPRSDVHPDECVALGAAMQALRYVDAGAASPEIEAKIEEQLEKMGQVVDVTGHSLGVRVGRDDMSVLITKNSPIPASSEQIYETAADFATTVKIVVYQGEESIASRNTLLTEFDLSDLPPMPKGEVTIKIRFVLDLNGVLNIEATNLIDNRIVNITTKYGGATSARPEDLVGSVAAAAPAAPRTAQGPVIPPEMQDTWKKAQELLAKLDAPQRAALDAAMQSYTAALARRDAKGSADQADALMDTLFEVMPV